MIREPYSLVKFGKKVLLIESQKIIINGNTPVGDDPEYWIAMPYGGQKPVSFVASFNFGINGELTKWCNTFGHQQYPKQ
jgi:hypothetical protein